MYCGKPIGHGKQTHPILGGGAEAAAVLRTHLPVTLGACGSSRYGPASPRAPLLAAACAAPQTEPGGTWPRASTLSQNMGSEWAFLPWLLTPRTSSNIPPKARENKTMRVPRCQLPPWEVTQMDVSAFYEALRLSRPLSLLCMCLTLIYVTKSNFGLAEQVLRSDQTSDNTPPSFQSCKRRKPTGSSLL